jgi:ABC-type oligopeptide transport system substrate-binding subunit
MNTSRPLFSNVRLRRAVNYAIDRSALAAQDQRFTDVGPFYAGSPADDYMPPSIAGAASSHFYPLAPDLRRARQLAGNVHATAIMYTPNYSPWLQEAQIISRDLQPLGIDVQVKEFSVSTYFDRISRPGEPFDLAVVSWDFNTADPAEFLELFDGSTNNAVDNLTDFSHLNDPAFDRQLRAAAALSGYRRYRTYSQLALELERDLAPTAVFATDVSRDFFSARMGCQLNQPVYGIDLAALCLRSSGS